MIKNFKHIFSITSLVIFIFLAFASGTGSDPNNGSTVTKYTTVSLTAGYLNFCNSVFEGEKPIQITISVDRYTGTGTFDTNFKTYRYRRTNSNDFSNYEFRNIEIPQSGTFGITVTVDTFGCFECCPNGEGCYPYFRGISTTYNASSSPNFMSITPTLANCFN